MEGAIPYDGAFSLTVTRPVSRHLWVLVRVARLVGSNEASEFCLERVSLNLLRKAGVAGDEVALVEALQLRNARD